MFGASCTHDRQLRVRVRTLCAQFAGPGVVSEGQETQNIAPRPLSEMCERTALTRSPQHSHAAQKARDLLGSLGAERACLAAQRAFQTFMASSNDHLGFDSLIDYAWLADLLGNEDLYGLLAAATSRCFTDLVAVPDAQRLGECCALILVHSGEQAWQISLRTIARQVESVEILNFLRDLLEE